MPTVSLNAFLKILSKSTPQKAVAYARYLEPGGYDFYWMLKEAARGLTVKGNSLEDCAKPIQAIDRLVEKKHNLAALQSLDKWLKKQNVQSFFDCPSSSVSSPEGFLTVKLDPAFGCIRGNHRLMVHLWTSQSLSLPKNVAGCGLYLMKQNLCVGDFADCTPAILDLRKRELFIADALPPMIAPMVASELAWVDGFFKAYRRAA
ncbi:hypothetical protein [Bradyrhizobium monzae]|uniref:hypothetical protein n=1 Tax=Bradyrhizobium sp. Oc8 TaxID=2876780 RepID=UPI001F2ADEB9|nr:hypothetical protein [Bradyrhizobium sp. Oc8]